MKVYTYSELGNHGALGNQLWEVAGVISHAVRDDVRVKFNPEWAYRDCFSVPDNFFGIPEEYDEIVDFYPDYMQDLSHMRGCEGFISFLFRPPEIIREVLVDYPLEGFTGVHVRRGNNLTLPNHHPVPTLDYFEQALDQIKPKKIFVISDDLEWCKQQSIFKDATFGLGPPKDVDIMDLTKYGPTPIREAALDLHLFSLCSDHIISNSTLSWWGAYLAQGGRVIAPKQWFGPAYAHVDTSVMFPEGWVLL